MEQVEELPLDINTVANHKDTIKELLKPPPKEINEIFELAKELVA